MSYRDDDEATRRRHEAALRELGQVRERLSELGDLSSRAAELEQEVARTRRRVPLPLIDQLSVATPCRADWASMRGDARARHCDQCDQKVFDLSAMTRAQAEELLQRHGTSLCVRFYRRPDGTVMTADCPVGLRQVRTTRAVAGVLGATMVAGVALGTVGVLGLGVAMMGSPAYEEPVVMGQVAAAPSDDGAAAGEGATDEEPADDPQAPDPSR